MCDSKECSPASPLVDVQVSQKERSVLGDSENLKEYLK